MTDLKGNTRFLATLLLQNASMLKWTIDFCIRMKADIATGNMDAFEELELFRDTIIETNSQGSLGPLNLDSVDWQALLDHCNSQIKISEETVNREISAINSTRTQIRQGFSPKPLKEVLSTEEISVYMQKLREQEFGRAFRLHRLDDVLALIDWLDRNRGPFNSIELPREIKPLTRVKSGEYLASVWLQTLHLRYPEGIPWHRGHNNRLAS